MKVSLFDFQLPADLIATRPAVPRDAARLLEVADRLADRTMRELPGLLRPGDLMVVNDTRVIPARLTGHRGAVKVGVTLHKDLGAGAWRAYARPAKRLRPGHRIDFGPEFSADVVCKHPNGDLTLRFDRRGDALRAALGRIGVMPLPPYIRRESDKRDADDYQTIFAASDGAVAAPTAGLHFTDRLLSGLQDHGVGRAAITLHVGAGTFAPVRADDTADHRMHAESGVISAEVAGRINAERAAGGRVVAVGTTVLRLLESAAGADGRLYPFAGETDIFITPGYRFRMVDLLLTNFHLPRSTLFMLVSAFAGLERMQSAYRHAIRQGYRFYSYGDGCLLHPGAPR